MWGYTEIATTITIVLVLWVVIFQKRGLKTALFEIPPINPDEMKISEFKGGGANDYVMLKRFDDLINIIKPEAEEARDSVREKIVGYHVSFLKHSDYHEPYIRQGKIVSDTEDRLKTLTDRSLYHSLLKSVTRKKQLSPSNVIDIVFPVIERRWNDNERLFSSFLDYCRIEMGLDDDFQEILTGFYDKIEPDIRDLIESMHDEGHGFDERKLFASWKEVMSFVISTSEGK